jgi:hypothetical protein
MNRKLILLFIIFCVLSNLNVYSQPPDIGGDPNEVPVDGGLSLLLASGLGYGINKIKKTKCKPKQSV